MKFRILILFLFIMLIAMLALNIKPIGRHIFKINYEAFINKNAEVNKLDPLLVASVIKVESNFNAKAESNKNAHGLMQITDETAKWAAGQMKIDYSGSEQLYNSEYNIKMGCWYLNELNLEFGSDISLVLAAYNGGRGNVQKWLKDSNNSSDGKTLKYIPFKETDKYVKKVKTYYNIYKFLYSK